MADHVKRMAIVEVDFKFLAELLELPAGCEIEAIFTDPYRIGVLQIRLSGAGWNVPFEGASIPMTKGLVRMQRIFGLRPEITWDLPSG